MQIKSDWASFGGHQRVYEHESTELGCAMEVAVYTPPQAETEAVPVLTYMSEGGERV